MKKTQVHEVEAISCVGYANNIFHPEGMMKVLLGNHVLWMLQPEVLQTFHDRVKISESSTHCPACFIATLLDTEDLKSYQYRLNWLKEGENFPKLYPGYDVDECIEVVKKVITHKN